MKKILIINGYNKVVIVNDRDANVDPSKKMMNGNLATEIVKRTSDILTHKNYSITITEANPDCDVMKEVQK
jgi:hypothetical protein